MTANSFSIAGGAPVMTLDTLAEDRPEERRERQIFLSEAAQRRTRAVAP
jgi:hypothetical protein